LMVGIQLKKYKDFGSPIAGDPIKAQQLC